MLVFQELSGKGTKVTQPQLPINRRIYLGRSELLAVIPRCFPEKGQTLAGVSKGEKVERLVANQLDSYFFFDIFRLISSMSLGRRSARTLSTMLATLLWSPSGVAAAASCKSCSAPAATARAAVSGCADSGWSTSFFSFSFSLAWVSATPLPWLLSWT